MFNGMLAEMETGEGKTLTATLAAATAALAGCAVHIITVNDYLAERDAETMGPVFRALGVTVGCVKQGMDPDSRRAAYRCDVTYCSNKEIAFDYLRDRMVLGGKPRAIAMKMDALAGAGVKRRLLAAWTAIRHRGRGGQRPRGRGAHAADSVCGGQSQPGGIVAPAGP